VRGLKHHANNPKEGLHDGWTWIMAFLGTGYVYIMN
jgi:hypothetical protein